MCEKWNCFPQNSASIINNYYTLAQQIYYHKDISRKRNLAILSYDSSQFDWSFVEIWTCKVDYFFLQKQLAYHHFEDAKPWNITTSGKRVCPCYALLIFVELTISPIHISRLLTE